MLRPFRGILPTVAESAYVDPAAQVIGDVVIGERASVWPNATIRGDVNYIRIGDGTNIQDNSVLHVEHELYPLLIAANVTVGHSVVLHGCVIEEDCLIGIGAIILNGAKIGRGSVIAAGALIAEGVEIPPYSLVMGVPGKVKRPVSDEEKDRFRLNAAHYIDLAKHYREPKP